MSALIATALIPAVTSVIERLFPDREKQEAAKAELLKLEQSGQLKTLEMENRLAVKQLAVNEAEAKSEGIFKGGWRPATGWICAMGFGYQTLASPLMSWLASNLWGWGAPPALDMETLMTLLFGMLGLGAYRSFEKVKKK
jgi:hypothetical protein